MNTVKKLLTCLPAIAALGAKFKDLVTQQALMQPCVLYTQFWWFYMFIYDLFNGTLLDS